MKGVRKVARRVARASFYVGTFVGLSAYMLYLSYRAARHECDEEGVGGHSSR